MIHEFDMKTVFPAKVTVLGAARSGIAAARFFTERGIAVFLSDTCSRERLDKVLSGDGLAGVASEAGGHTGAVLDSDLIVLSPGIPSDIPVLLTAKQRGIPVWSEMELGFRACSARFLAVTGSTGKSTTVSLTGAALAQAGIEHVVAGNIGTPVTGAAPGISDRGYVVAEVSSFQLENVNRFRPFAAAVINLMKNHLDRYPSEESYYAAKMEIARNMTPDDRLVLNANDRRLAAWGRARAGRTGIVYFGADMAGYDSFWCSGTSLMYRFGGMQGNMGDLAEMRLIGTHNRENALVAAALAKIAGAGDEAIFRGIRSFPGLPHRLEFVAETGGVRWYNDSKSTTAESVDCAIRAFRGGVHLIAGGKDKGCDFSVVNGAIPGRVKGIVLIGEAAARIEREWRGLAPVRRVSTLEEAVGAAGAAALPGDSVLFSPGCSSFDMFRDYEERGWRFRDIVRRSAGKEAAGA